MSWKPLFLVLVLCRYRILYIRYFKRRHAYNCDQDYLQHFFLTRSEASTGSFSVHRDLGAIFLVSDLAVIFYPPLRDELRFSDACLIQAMGFLSVIEWFCVCGPVSRECRLQCTLPHSFIMSKSQVAHLDENKEPVRSTYFADPDSGLLCSRCPSPLVF